MNPAQAHLLVVHVPVLGCIAGVGFLIAARLARNETLFKSACAMLLISAVGGGASFFTGPGAYEQLAVPAGPERDLVETHAALGKGAALGLVLVGLASLLALLQYPQGETPAPALRWTLLAGAVLVSALLAWTAHQGGLVSHPEIRGTDHAPVAEQES